MLPPSALFTVDSFQFETKSDVLVKAVSFSQTILSLCKEIKNVSSYFILLIKYSFCKNYVLFIYGNSDLVIATQ